MSSSVVDSRPLARSVFLLLIAPLLLSTVAPAADSPSGRVAEQIAEGDRLSELGDHAAALGRYQKANRLAKGSSFEALIRLARTTFLMGRYKETVRHATDARALAETAAEQAELACLVGRSYFESSYLLGREVGEEELPEVWEQSMEMAENFFLNASATAPEAVPEARYFLGRINENQREIDDAERFYKDYLALAPGGEHVQSAQRRLGRLRMPPGEGPVEFGQDMLPPIKMYGPNPTYTPEAREARIQGTVIVRMVIDRVGEVTSVELVQGLPHGLDQAALAAVRRWRFKPARLADGRPLAVYYTLTVNFKLQSDKEKPGQ